MNSFCPPSYGEFTVISKKRNISPGQNTLKSKFASYTITPTETTKFGTDLEQWIHSTHHLHGATLPMTGCMANACCHWSCSEYGAQVVFVTVDLFRSRQSHQQTSGKWNEEYNIWGLLHHYFSGQAPNVRNHFYLRFYHCQRRIQPWLEGGGG